MSHVPWIPRAVAGAQFHGLVPPAKALDVLHGLPKQEVQARNPPKMVIGHGLEFGHFMWIHGASTRDLQRQFQNEKKMRQSRKQMFSNALRAKSIVVAGEKGRLVLMRLRVGSYQDHKTRALFTCRRFMFFSRVLDTNECHFQPNHFARTSTAPGVLHH